MPIVTSILYLGHPQADGRRHVRELHEDHAGRLHEASYLADPGTDHQAVMAARVPVIEARAKQAELDACVSELLAGRNPFPAGGADLVWNTRIEALGHVFAELMPRPALEVAMVIPLVDAVSDAELAAAGFAPEQVSAIRARAAEIAAVLPTLTAPAFGG